MATDRTSINTDKANHRRANWVKGMYNDSWPDVLAFYWMYRAEYPEHATDYYAQHSAWGNKSNGETENIERRLEDIETELTELDKVDGQSFLNRVKTLEEKLNDVLNELDDIREAMEAQR